MSLPVGSHQASIRKRLKELKRSAVPAGRVPLSHSWPAPSERPTSQGGFAACPAPLRSAGLLLPPGPPCLLHSWPAPSERPTSQGGFAACPAPLRSARLLPPPGPPCLLHSWPAPSER